MGEKMKAVAVVSEESVKPKAGRKAMPPIASIKMYVKPEEMFKNA